MDICIEPGMLSGAVKPPPSKSMAHRLLIAAALADGVSTVQNVAFSQDIQATLRCLEQLGACWEETAPGVLQITGLPKGQSWPEFPQLDCGESGSTLRFLLPVVLALAGGGSFLGHGRLMERPLEPYFQIFKQQNIQYSLKNGVLTVRGTLSPGVFTLPGNVSSQFFTGLLYALPLLDAPSTLSAATELQSHGYILMTLDAIQRAGGSIAELQAAKPSFSITPFFYLPFDQSVEADWSQAAFWYAAAFLGSMIQITGLKEDSLQGDRVIRDFYSKMLRPGTVQIDLSNCPDLLPPLAVMAAARNNRMTRFVNAGRLRMKESDRLATVTSMLKSLGVQAEEGTDSLTVCGRPGFTGGTVDGCGDHRIVMAAAVAATRAIAPVTIVGAEAVQKSYPGFWDIYQQLGGKFHVL